MFNWIGMNLVNFLIPNMPRMLDSTGAPPPLTGPPPWPTPIPAPSCSRLGLDRLFHYSYMNIGIILAIVVSIVMWVILKKTTFGYELKACGNNRDAAMYAGISAKKNVVLSMVISGALAGFGGGLFYLAGGGQYTLLQAIETAGFDGISVALLANCNPIGCIFSAMFLSYLRLGGNAMQSQGYATEATDIVISVIVYLAAFAPADPDVPVRQIGPA